MIKLDSHYVELEDFTWEVHSTLDNPKDETFTPTVVFVSGKTRIANQLPPQPYVNGTWSDKDVNDAVENYIQLITV